MANRDATAGRGGAGGTGRAAVLERPHSVRLLRDARPDAREGDAVVRIRASGVCGTDVEIYSGHIPAAPGRVMGHEGAGIVESAPAGAGFEAGTPVVIDPVLACGRCLSCREDLPNLCLRGGLLGRDHDGVFADAIAVPAANCFPLREGIALEDAPAAQVLATVAHAQELVHVVPGRVAAVIGLGFTGQLHAQLLRHRGARVLGVTRTAEKRAIAAGLACEWTAAPEDASAAVREATAAGFADLVVEASGSVAGAAQAIELVRPGGILLWYGTCTATAGELPFYSIYYKEIRMIAARASKPRDMEIALDLMASRAVETGPLVSDRLALDDVEAALERSRRGALKVVMAH